MKKEFEELKKVCEPVAEYLKVNHDPHTYVVVSMDSIKLVSEQMGVPVDIEEPQKFTPCDSDGIRN